MSGNRRLRRLGLGVSVSLLLDDGGVGAERHVVHEEAPVHGGVVHAAFDGIGEGMEALARISAVEAEVEGEMVAGPCRHADEREIVLHRDGRHQCLRAVPAGHPEAVGPVGHGLTSQHFEVEPVVEQDRLHAQGVGLADEAELLDLAAAGPRIAEQRRTSGPRCMVDVGDSDLAQVGVERRLRREDGEGEQRKRHDQHHQGGQILVAGPEQGHHQHHRAQEEGEEADGATRHAFGDDPPPADDAQSQTDETDDEEDAVAEEEDHQDDRQGHTRGERHDRPEAGASGPSPLLFPSLTFLRHPAPVASRSAAL